MKKVIQPGFVQNTEQTIINSINSVFYKYGIYINQIKLKKSLHKYYYNQLVLNFHKPFDCIDRLIGYLLIGEELEDLKNLLIKEVKILCELDRLQDIIIENSTLKDLEDLILSNYKSIKLPDSV